MNVFICWSGTRSRDVAEALKKFFQDLNSRRLFPDGFRFDPFHSDDIEKGAAWFQAVTDRLGKADAAVLVVTPENAASPWMHFEAGAVVSQMLRQRHASAGAQAGEGPLPGRLFTYLFGFEAHEHLQGPLSAYQATAATCADTRAMLRSMLGLAEGDRWPGVPDAVAERATEASFVLCWNELAERLRASRAQPVTAICPDFDKTLSYKTFREPVAECHRQEWIRRIARCHDTHLALEAAVAQVEARCSEYESELFRQLVAALDAYEMAMDSHLVTEASFPIDGAGDCSCRRVSKRFASAAGARCSTRWPCCSTRTARPFSPSPRLLRAWRPRRSARTSFIGNPRP